MEKEIAILIPPRDFKDETLKRAIDLMRKWDVEPVIASWTRNECVGSHGAVYRPMATASEVTSDRFDGIFIPDGEGVDTFKLYDVRPLLDTIKHFAEKKKPIACVNNAIKILARANIITDLKIAAVKDKETARLVTLFHGRMTDKFMESDGNILTLGDGNRTEELVDMFLDRIGAR